MTPPPPALLDILRDSGAKKAKRLEKAFTGIHETTPQAELMRRWSQVHEHLVAIPTKERITPERFSAFRTKFLTSQTSDLSNFLSGTRARMQELGISCHQQEGKAIVLSLILGPRFFEDPFKPWAHLPAEEAIDAAWNFTIGSDQHG